MCAFGMQIVTLCHSRGLNNMSTIGTDSTASLYPGPILLLCAL